MTLNKGKTLGPMLIVWSMSLFFTGCFKKTVIESCGNGGTIVVTKTPDNNSGARGTDPTTTPSSQPTDTPTGPSTTTGTPEKPFQGPTFEVVVVKSDGVTPQPGAQIVCVDDPEKKGITDENGRATVPVGEGTYIVILFNQPVSKPFGPVKEGETHTVVLDHTQTKSIKLAVVAGEYDHVETILQQMGYKIGEQVKIYDKKLDKNNPNSVYYLFFRGTDEIAPDPTLLSQYNAVFFNCGVYQDRESELMLKAVVRNALKGYVENGGYLYVSDYAYYDAVEAIWPTLVDWYQSLNTSSPKFGKPEKLIAKVVDPALISALGKSSVELNFNLDAWVIIQGVDAETSTLISGDVNTHGDGKLSGVPLMIRRVIGEGTVLFTSFHNEAQVTGDMVKILKLVLASSY